MGSGHGGLGGRYVASPISTIDERGLQGTLG